MYWYRLERSLGRSSLVGTTVQAPERLPRHLAADEKHTTLVERKNKSRKAYLAATAGGGCCLGLALAETADADELTRAYGVFRDEALLLDPKYRPETVNTDGWAATQAAWRALFQGVTLILCFLHAFLKIRERAKHLRETFAEVSRRVWEAYQAPDARSFAQRLRRLREWATIIPRRCGATMADVIEYPSDRVKPDSVPRPGDRYEAYGLYHKIKPVSIFFVFADWTMQAFRCDRLGHCSFGLLNDKGDVHGRCALTLSFGTGLDLYEVVITGDNIFGLGSNLDALMWVWELPKDRAAVEEGQPVVHSIEIREKPARGRP